MQKPHTKCHNIFGHRVNKFSVQELKDAEAERQSASQTDEQTVGETGRQQDIHADRQEDRQTDKHADRQIDRLADRASRKVVGATKVAFDKHDTKRNSANNKCGRQLNNDNHDDDDDDAEGWIAIMIMIIMLHVAFALNNVDDV